MLAGELNSDFASLFNEKKYREMQAVATESQASLIESTQSLAEPLVKLLHTSASLSVKRHAQLVKEDSQDAQMVQSVEGYLKVFSSVEQSFV